MNKEFLLKLIEENPECEWIEFKSNYPAKKYYQEIGEYISALSNSAALNEQKYGYMIWGIKNSSKRIIGTNFKYDLEINGSEVFKHYLARNLQPSIALKFETLAIDGKRIVYLRIPAAHSVITEFKKERYIRIGSSKERLKKYPEYESDLWTTLSGSKDITIIPSRRSTLTFQCLKNYLSNSYFKYDNSTFEANLNLRTPNGDYNLMAELLADKNDISVDVSVFANTDKSHLLRQFESNGKCLLLAMEEAKNYILAINQTHVDTTIRPRKEIKMFSMDAFKEAWYNACVHYKWNEMSSVHIYVYSDRIEIESYGGIPKGLTKTKFLNGISKPINKALFNIFKICKFAEGSGHGVRTIVEKYGEDAFTFDGNFIYVTIPFNKFVRDGRGTTQANILNLLKSDRHLTRRKLAEILHLTEDGIKYHMNELKKKSKLIHHGSTKAGYWEVKE